MSRGIEGWRSFLRQGICKITIIRRRRQGTYGWLALEQFSNVIEWSLPLGFGEVSIVYKSFIV